MTDLPTASDAEYPKMVSAPGFHVVITPVERLRHDRVVRLLDHGREQVTRFLRLLACADVFDHADEAEDVTIVLMPKRGDAHLAPDGPAVGAHITLLERVAGDVAFQQLPQLDWVGSRSSGYVTSTKVSDRSSSGV